MMKDRDLTRLVEQAIADAIAANRVVQKPWLTQQLVKGQIPEGDSDCAHACAYHAFSTIIGDVIRKTKERNAEADPQLTLPGYERLQRAYAVTRKKEPCIVPIDLMTLTEGRRKARELRAFAQGALEHAQELDAYFDAREVA